MLSPGFADPVFESQACFRALMTALSEPGRVIPLAPPLAPPAPLSATVASVLLTLLDPETSLWCSPSFREVAPWLRFHTGVRALPAEQAAFALVAPERDGLALTAFPAGEERYPDRGATIVLAVPALMGGRALRLTGPGIATTMTVAPLGLPADFVAQWRANHGRYPLGVDLVLAAEGGIMGLPRSVAIEEHG